MKVNIYDIPEEGLVLDVVEEGENLAAMAGPLDFTFRSPVSAHIEIIRADDNVVTSGEMNVILGFSCGRCLKEFDLPISSEFRLYYAGGGQQAAEGAKTRQAEKKPHGKDELEEGEEADLDEPSNAHIHNGELDVSEALLEQIALEVPIQPLCSDECKGLCPKCGVDLNVTACSCKTEERVDARFSKLKDFKKKIK